MEPPPKSTANAAWQASKLSVEKSKLDAGLAKTQEIIDLHPVYIES